jgi:hypothetical protein
MSNMKKSVKEIFGRGVQISKRLGVFFLGGFICPRCGEAQVKFGSYLLIFNCPGCKKLFMAGDPVVDPKVMWKMVWRKK